MMHPIWKQIAIRQDTDDSLYAICRRSVDLDPRYVVSYQKVAAETSKVTRQFLWDMMGWPPEDAP